MILDSNESAIFALVIKTVYIKMAKVGCFLYDLYTTVSLHPFSLSIKTVIIFLEYIANFCHQYDCQ